MDIFEYIKPLVSAFRRSSGETDYLLDQWIRDALIEEVSTPLPSGTWECLRKAIADRKFVKSYGMWILDEPFRDPPTSPPGTLSGAQLKRAQRIYADTRGDQIRPSREIIWSSLMPSVAILINI